jgi:site-specific DNA recombinase
MMKRSRCRYKCQGNPASCRRRYVREALHASHADERREHEEAIRRLQGEHRRLVGDRINAMYVDKLDGRVDGAFFDKMSAEWREEQNRCLHPTCLPERWNFIEPRRGKI